MWYAILAVACIFLGGAGGYLWGQIVKDRVHADFLRAEGYVKRGQDWIKAKL
jgi:hypothetical protein